MLLKPGGDTTALQPRDHRRRCCHNLNVRASWPARGERQPFVGFVLLSFGCNLALDWLPTPANNLTSGLINLWVSIGLMRGV